MLLFNCICFILCAVFISVILHLFLKYSPQKLTPLATVNKFSYVVLKLYINAIKFTLKRLQIFKFAMRF